MIGMNLQTLRRNHKLTQEQVAEKVGVSRQAVAKWESGDSLPDIENCRALAMLFDVSLDNLVGEWDAATAPLIPPKGKHIFGTVTVGERGQIVIPKKARDVFGLRPGDSLMVLGDEALGGLGILKTDLFLRTIDPLIQAAARAGGEARRDEG